MGVLDTLDKIMTPEDIEVSEKQFRQEKGTFETEEAKQQLEEFKEFEKTHKPKQNSIKELRKKVADKRNR